VHRFFIRVLSEERLLKAESEPARILRIFHAYDLIEVADVAIVARFKNLRVEHICTLPFFAVPLKTRLYILRSDDFEESLSYSLELVFFFSQFAKAGQDLIESAF
jgi:hypothetical protein